MPSRGVLRYEAGVDLYLTQAEMGYEHRIVPTANLTVRMSGLGEDFDTVIEHAGDLHTITVHFSDDSAATSLAAGEKSVGSVNVADSSVVVPA